MILCTLIVYVDNMLCTDLCGVSEQVARKLIGDEVCRFKFSCDAPFSSVFLSALEPTPRVQTEATCVGLSSHGPFGSTAAGLLCVLYVVASLCTC